MSKMKCLKSGLTINNKYIILIEIIGKGYILGLTSEGLYVHTYIKKQSNQ